MGPYLIFADYTALVHETVFVNTPSKEGAKVQRSMPIGRKQSAYRKMLRGITFLGLFVVFGPNFNFGALLLDSWKEKAKISQYVKVKCLFKTSLTLSEKISVDTNHWLL